MHQRWSRQQFDERNADKKLVNVMLTKDAILQLNAWPMLYDLKWAHRRVPIQHLRQLTGLLRNHETARAASRNDLAASRVQSRSSSIPNGIPRTNKNDIIFYISIGYSIISNYPGPPNTKQNKTRQVRVLLHLGYPMLLRIVVAFMSASAIFQRYTSPAFCQKPKSLFFKTVLHLEWDALPGSSS